MTLLRRAGQTIGPLDVLTAAIAMTLPDCAVVSNDNDMKLIPGLAIENWRELAQKS